MGRIYERGGLVEGGRDILDKQQGGKCACFIGS